MKISKIEQDGMIFTVTLSPNWLERLFMRKERIVKYKRTWSTFVLGGGNVYVNQKGEKVSNWDWIGQALDNHIRKF